MLIGTICALVSAAYVDLWAFPQLRFCPLDMEDSLPLTNSGSNIAGADWATQNDPYYWNDTVQFSFQNRSLPNLGLPTICLYPCFATQWPLRNPTEIVAISGNTGSVGDSQTGWSLFFAVYAAVSASGLSGLTVLAISVADWLPKGTSSHSRKWMTIPAKKRLLAAWHCYLYVVQFYVRFLSPIPLAFFVAWIEWYMWTEDPQGETFRHVGQWGSLVAASLVAAGAVISYYWAIIRGEDDSDSQS